MHRKAKPEERKGTPHASLLKSNSERKKESERERERGSSNKNWGEKKRIWKDGRKKGEKGSPGKNLPRTMLL